MGAPPTWPSRPRGRSPTPSRWPCRSTPWWPPSPQSRATGAPSPRPSATPGSTLAAYEATRLSGNAPADRYDAGDEGALTPRQRRGRELFFGRAGCNKCHLGPNYTDSRFHNLGSGWLQPAPGAPPASGFADPGRAAVTHDPRDTGAFKTPTLREVSRRAPYMHDGSLATLRDAVAHYRLGGTPNPWLSELSKPIPLSGAEVDELVAFLLALDGEGFADQPPRSFPR